VLIEKTKNKGVYLVKNYSHYNPTEFIAGCTAIESVGKHAKMLGNHALRKHRKHRDGSCAS
jgi:hypothetical protein